jgi:hypothetical protein
MQGDPLDEWIDRACEANPLPPFDEEDEPPRGPPLDKMEIKAACCGLATWQMPDVFANVTQALSSRCSSGDWFSRPDLKFLHDAYVLAKFASLWPVGSVRLAGASEQWPDGYVKIGATIVRVEITSTHGGRKLGQEYCGPQTLAMDPVENWVARAESIPHYLDEAILAKSKRNYGSSCWLVVYLNISEYGVRQAEIERSIASIKQSYSGSFEAITVLWKDKLY